MNVDFLFKNLTFFKIMVVYLFLLLFKRKKSIISIKVLY